MKSFLNILFATIAFSFCVSIAYLTKNEIVLNAVILAFFDTVGCFYTSLFISD